MQEWRLGSGIRLASSFQSECYRPKINSQWFASTVLKFLTNFFRKVPLPLLSWNRFELEKKSFRIWWYSYSSLSFQQNVVTEKFSPFLRMSASTVACLHDFRAWDVIILTSMAISLGFESYTQTETSSVHHRRSLGKNSEYLVLWGIFRGSTQISPCRNALKSNFLEVCFIPWTSQKSLQKSALRWLHLCSALKMTPCTTEKHSRHQTQRETKGQQLKGKIVSEFSHFFILFPQGLSPSKQRILAQGEQKRRKDNKKAGQTDVAR